MDVSSRNNLIDSYFRALDTEEYELLCKVFSEDVTYLYPGGEHLHGLSEVLEYFSERRPTRNSSHEITRRIHTDEATCIEGRFTGERSGGTISADCSNVFEFSDDASRMTYNAVYMRRADRVD